VKNKQLWFFYVVHVEVSISVNDTSKFLKTKFQSEVNTTSKQQQKLQGYTSDSKSQKKTKNEISLDRTKKKALKKK